MAKSKRKSKKSRKAGRRGGSRKSVSEKAKRWKALSKINHRIRMFDHGKSGVSYPIARIQLVPLRRRAKLGYAHRISLDPSVAAGQAFAVLPANGLFDVGGLFDSRAAENLKVYQTLYTSYFVHSSVATFQVVGLAGSPILGASVPHSLGGYITDHASSIAQLTGIFQGDYRTNISNLGRTEFGSKTFTPASLANGQAALGDKAPMITMKYDAKQFYGPEDTVQGREAYSVIRGDLVTPTTGNPSASAMAGDPFGRSALASFVFQLSLAGDMDSSTACDVRIMCRYTCVYDVEFTVVKAYVQPV